MEIKLYSGFMKIGQYLNFEVYMNERSDMFLKCIDFKTFFVLRNLFFFK